MIGAVRFTCTTPRELLGRVALDRTALVGAGVVDEDVDAAEALGDVREQARGRLRVADVGRDGERAAAAAFELGGERLERGAAPRRECHRGTFRGELAGGGGADARRCAGDDDDLAFESTAHRCRAMGRPPDLSTVALTCRTAIDLNAAPCPPRPKRSARSSPTASPPSGRFSASTDARIATVADLIVARFSEGSKLLLFGNGGSAADAPAHRRRVH